MRTVHEAVEQRSRQKNLSQLDGIQFYWQHKHYAHHRARVNRRKHRLTNFRAGVIGLTTALRLVQTGYKVVIIARHRPFDRDINYASPWAGGHYRPSPDIDPIGRFEADLARATYEEFKKIAQDVLSGVEFMPGVEYFENPSDAYLSLNDHRYSDIEGFRVLNQSELPSGVNYGTTYKTYSLNPPVYLAWLERQLVLAGVKFEQHSLIQLLDAFAIMKDVSPKILINCSGFGFSDPNVYPTRGMKENKRLN